MQQCSTKQYRKANKKSRARKGLLLWNFFSQGDLIDPQILQAIANALGHPPEADKTLLLESQNMEK